MEVEVLLAELKICTSTRNLEKGKQLHSDAMQTGRDSCIYVANSLVNMYAKCGSMSDARRVFDSIKHPTVVSWNVLIMGYADNGEGITALDLFARMKTQGEPTSITFIAALKACTSLAHKQGENGIEECRKRGTQIHLDISWNASLPVQNTLIAMYAKCGCLAEARQVFNSITDLNVVSWNALILGYAENGEGLTALDLFETMKTQGYAPNSITFLAVLKACTSLASKQDANGIEQCRERGMQIHSEIGSHSKISVLNSLIDMYTKCGIMVEARKVFDSIEHPTVVSWNALILGYAENGEGITALDLFSIMKAQGYVPNSVTFLAALKACTSIAQSPNPSGKVECTELGSQIHLEIGCHMDIYVQTTLMDMYGKCGRMIEAREVFDSIKHPNVVSWTALILGYADNGEGVTALDMYSRMRSQGYAPNCVTFAAALKACGVLGAFECGSKIHAEIDTETAEAERDVMLVTCLVDFYAKCGSLLEAHRVFDLHHRTRDLATWNALMAGYSRLGDDITVFGLLERILDAGFQPSVITILCILTCCSHAGLVEKAKEFFKAMVSSYGIAPTVEHYTCMVDIFSRLNKLDDGLALLRSMPCSHDTVAWMTVLGACRKWKNVWVGRLAFKSVVSLDDRNGAAYVLMANIYGSKGMWEEQDLVLRRFQLERS